MRLRLFLLIACFALALAASAGASVFPWPIKPFNKQHPIRGYFGDPRTVYENGKVLHQDFFASHYAPVWGGPLVAPDPPKP